jgi:hypothetical protein
MMGVVSGTGALPALGDPLLFFAELSCVETLYPLGYPVRIETNSRAVLEAARESWALFAGARRTPPVVLRVIVSGQEPAASWQPPTFRARQHVFAIVDGAANFAFCDFASGTAFCWVTAATVAARAAFRYHFLETMAYSILTDLYLAPIHAACVALEGRGLLLCGPSGAGKSTLAFACARRGWTLISDDACFLVRDSDDRTVLGRPHQMRFRPSAAQLFPELAGCLVGVHPNGKLLVEVSTGAFSGLVTGVEARVDFIAFLDFEAGTRAELLAVSAAGLAARLAEGLAPFGRTHNERIACLARLAEVPAYRFRYSDLDEAVSCLENLLLRGRP